MNINKKSPVWLTAAMLLVLTVMVSAAYAMQPYKPSWERWESNKKFFDDNTPLTKIYPISKIIPEVYSKYDMIGVLIIFEEGSKGPGSLRKDRREKMKELWTHDYIYTRPLNTNGLGYYLSMKWYEKIIARLLQGVKPTEDERIRPLKEGDEVQLVVFDVPSHPIETKREVITAERVYFAFEPVKK